MSSLVDEALLELTYHVHSLAINTFLPCKITVIYAYSKPFSLLQSPLITRYALSQWVYTLTVDRALDWDGACWLRWRWAL